MRSARQRQRGQTLIIIFFGMLLFGGSALVGGVFATGKSVKELRTEIGHIVQDRQRREQADAVLKHWDDAIAGYVGLRRQYGKDMTALLARHDASQQDFDQLFASIEPVNEVALRTLLDQRSALRQALTAEEWRQVFAVPAMGTAKTEK